MKALASLMVLVGCTSLLSAGTAPAGVKQMEVYSVTPQFALVYSPRWGENDVMFISLDDRPELSRLVLFRSANLQSGDQVVSIDGTMVAEMQPHHCRMILSRVKPEKRVVLVVRSNDTGKLREVTASRVRSPSQP